MNGNIIQFFLSVCHCERQYTFNNIVDLKQRSLGLLLESNGDDMNFMMITKVPSLTSAANTQLDRNPTELYNLEEGDEIITYEQITYLINLNQPDEITSSRYGTVISFQEGKEGDVFEEVSNKLYMMQP